ncbi:FecR family protein [Pseudomonas sp. YH-1]|uniref:FecR family protein n=1 Tax=Pseudomonas sp. YH-1 TaxID=3384787 RepID=UPI003F7E9F13
MKASDTTLRQAAEWLVRLDGKPDENAHRDFQAWLGESPEHAAAVARLQGHLEPLQGLASRAAGKALRRPRGKPAVRAVQTLAFAACLLGTAMLAGRYWQQGYWLADLNTASGQRLDQVLADGSQVHLDSDSAIDLQIDANQRRIRLLHGEVLVEVAKDKRPFYVITPQGSVRALGTRFSVERQEHGTVVTMLESSTLIESSGKSLQLDAGQRVRLAEDGPGQVEPVDAHALDGAWRDRQLLAQDQPLSDVLERLSRQQRGLLLFDRAALASLRVTVMLPLDDSPRALRLLQRTLPIQVSQFTPWVTRVSLREDGVQE